MKKPVWLSSLLFFAAPLSAFPCSGLFSEAIEGNHVSVVTKYSPAAVDRIEYRVGEKVFGEIELPFGEKYLGSSADSKYRNAVVVTDWGIHLYEIKSGKFVASLSNVGLDFYHVDGLNISWSHDGRKVAYSHHIGGKIYLVRLFNLDRPERPRDLLNTGDAFFFRGVRPVGLAWNAESTEISAKFKRSWSARNQVYRFDLEGNTITWGYEN